MQPATSWNSGASSTPDIGGTQPKLDGLKPEQGVKERCKSWSCSESVFESKL
jgi:hypothetical protein